MITSVWSRLASGYSSDVEAISKHISINICGLEILMSWRRVEQSDSCRKNVEYSSACFVFIAKNDILAWSVQMLVVPSIDPVLKLWQFVDLATQGS